jgi:hypothetical protein
MVGWSFCGIVYESLQQFYGDIFQFTFAFGYEQLACHFFNSSINLWDMACCTLATWVNIICSQEQKDSTINNNFLGPVICGGRFGFYGTSHHSFWINNKPKLISSSSCFYEPQLFHGIQALPPLLCITV